MSAKFLVDVGRGCAIREKVGLGLPEDKAIGAPDVEAANLPLVGEMPGRAEGGGKDRLPHSVYKYQKQA